MKLKTYLKYLILTKVLVPIDLNFSVIVISMNHGNLFLKLSILCCLTVVTVELYMY